jgi:hypothetical protein
MIHLGTNGQDHNAQSLLISHFVQIRFIWCSLSTTLIGVTDDETFRAAAELVLKTPA